MGNIQMVGKSVGEMYKGEKPLETKLAPLGLFNDIARHAVDFWLVDGGPARSEQSRHRGPKREDHAELHAEQSSAATTAIRAS